MTGSNTILKEGLVELSASIDTLARVHGHHKASVALMLHNCNVLLHMLHRRDIDVEIVAMLDRQFTFMLGTIYILDDLDPEEITNIARGISEQASMLTVDAIEAEKDNHEEAR